MRALPFCLSTVVVILMGVCGLAAVADDASFPGRGSYEVWRKANDLFDDGRDLEIAGKYDLAISKLKAAIAKYPYDHGYFNELGVAYKRKGDLKSAENYLRRAVQMKPSVYEGWNNLGNVLRRQGRFEEAIALYKRALDCHPPTSAQKVIKGNISDSVSGLQAQSQGKGISQVEAH